MENKKRILNHLLPDDFKQLMAKGDRMILYLKQQTTKKVSLKTADLDKFEFNLDNKRIVYSGDILKRPMKSFKIGQNIGAFHYGIVFGLSKNSERLVLDMSDETDISVRTLEDFVRPFTINDIIFDSKPETVSFGEILERADKLIFESYSIENLNCEQFVNYCVYNNAESIGLQNTSKIISSLFDLLTAFTEYKLSFTPDSKSKESIENFNNKLKAMSVDMKSLK